MTSRHFSLTPALMMPRRNTMAPKRIIQYVATSMTATDAAPSHQATSPRTIRIGIVSGAVGGMNDAI